MAYNFLPVERDQTYLMPPSLADWLSEDHLCWFVLDAVDEIDLALFYRRYRSDGWGAAAFDPKMMVALLLYAYCVGERSARRIERRCNEDVAFRVICANQVPDHTTIARFRQTNEHALGACFTEVLKLCQAAGLLRVGLVALDGTKVEADASIGANRTPQIESEVARMLEEASRTDAEEDERLGPARGDEVPNELKDRRSRLARLAECKARLEEEAASREAAYQGHLARRAVIEAERGSPLRGRKPVLKGPRSLTSAKANTTDPDSRIMKGPRGFIQGYNAQAVVSENQIVLAAAVTHEANDRRQLRPMLQKTPSQPRTDQRGPDWGARGRHRLLERKRACRGGSGLGRAAGCDAGTSGTDVDGALPPHDVDESHAAQASNQTRATALREKGADRRADLRRGQRSS